MVVLVNDGEETGPPPPVHSEPEVSTEVDTLPSMIKESSQRPMIRGGVKAGRAYTDPKPNALRPGMMEYGVCRTWITTGDCFQAKYQILHPLDRMFDTPVWSKRLATTKTALRNKPPSQSPQAFP